MEIIRSTAHLIIQFASQGGLGKAALYAHLDQAIDDVKSGRVQEVDEAFDDILSELDRVKI